MSIQWFNRKAITGGGATALDAILSASINDGDRAFVLLDGGLFYVYQFDATGTSVESSPVVIRPNDYSGAGVWRLKRWSDAQPVGTCSLWLADTPPAQHMIINGADLSRTVYPELFAVWGTTFGDGDGSTTFGTPAPQGYFPRFTDNGAGVDPDADSRADRGDGTIGDNVGTLQEDELKSHGVHGGTTGNYSSSSGMKKYVINTSDVGGNETRGKNMGFHLIVKYE